MTKTLGTILPGSTVGIFGGGQLGRMFAIAARTMGYRVHTFSDDRDLPANQLADVEVVADYRDLEAVESFAKKVDVISFEFENVPAESIRAAEQIRPVRPGSDVLHACQHRIREKSFLQTHGFPSAEWTTVYTRADVERGIRQLGYPVVLKSASFGYDGKGQTKISMPSDIDGAMSVAGREAVLEKWIDCAMEISVIGAREAGGDFRHFGVIENRHIMKVLDLSIAPAAALPPSVVIEAVEITRAVLEQLGVVGVLCIEFFLTKDGKLLINELAPRPHDSGHLTIDACVTSQFEQQLRAVCGLPLGRTDFHRPAAMANILGDLWQGGVPDWSAALALDSVKLHLYGKDEPRAGRKMGHLTATAASNEAALELVIQARRALTSAHPTLLQR